MSTTSRYDAHADWYLEYTRDWESPAAEGFLPRQLSGGRVLDLACGWGQLSRVLADRGAEVVAVDLAENFIARAREIEQQEQRGIEFLHGSATSTDWWDSTPFDGVVCNMALMDIDDLEAAVATAWTVLKPGGWFVVSLFHPCHPGEPGARSSSWPPEGGYAAEWWWSTEETGVRGHVGAHHRMLSTYLNALLRAGFVFDEFDEPPSRLPFVFQARCHKRE